MPSSEYIAPDDLFTGNKLPCHKLKDICMWGCPVYGLYPTLQGRHKLPKWQPQSCHGIFVGFSLNYSSDVPLILNPATGPISPQRHVIFDDLFSPVLYIYTEE